MTVIFDTLSYTKGAEAIGIKREHAEYQAEQICKLVSNELTTKKDLEDLKNQLIIKLGAIMVICAGIITTILGFIIKH